MTTKTYGPGNRRHPPWESISNDLEKGVSLRRREKWSHRARLAPDGRGATYLCDDCRTRNAKALAEFGAWLEAREAKERAENERRARQVRTWLENAPVYSVPLLEKERQRYNEKHRKAYPANDPDAGQRKEIQLLRWELSHRFHPWVDVLDIEDAVEALAPLLDNFDRRPSWKEPELWRGPELAGAPRHKKSFLHVRFADSDAGLPQNHADALRLERDFYFQDRRYRDTAIGSVYRGSAGTTVILWV